MKRIEGWDLKAFRQQIKLFSTIQHFLLSSLLAEIAPVALILSQINTARLGMGTHLGKKNLNSVHTRVIICTYMYVFLYVAKQTDKFISFPYFSP